MPHFTTTSSGVTICAEDYHVMRYRAAMLRAFQARAVSLPPIPDTWTPTEGGSGAALHAGAV